MVRLQPTTTSEAPAHHHSVLFLVRYMIHFAHSQQDLVHMFGPASHADGWQCHLSGEWLHIVDEGLFEEFAETRVHYHGTCLSSIRPIRSHGFKTSPPAHGCPTGIWGITAAAVHGHDWGHALERAKLSRGWLQPAVDQEQPWLNGWTTPVVIGLRPYVQELKLFHSVGNPPCRVQIWKRPEDAVVTYGKHFEILVHLPSYRRFRALPTLYASLRMGTLVLCCCRLQEPHGALDCNYVTCGKTCNVADCHAYGWRQARKSKLWFCNQCWSTRVGNNHPWTSQ